MASYYTQFSCLLPVGSAANVKAALAIYEAFTAEKASTGDVLGFEAEKHSTDGEDGEASEVWITSDDGDPEDVLTYVFRCAEALGFSGIWGFCWSMSCSKARLDGFGGGAQVVDLGTRETVDWIDLGEWLAEQADDYLLADR